MDKINERHVLVMIREALKEPSIRAQIIDMMVRAYSVQLPVEPLFTLEAAARLVPVKHKRGLEYWTHKLEIPKRYRIRKDRRRERMLYATEILAIRRGVIRGDINRAILTGESAKRKTRKREEETGQGLIQ